MLLYKMEPNNRINNVSSVAVIKSDTELVYSSTARVIVAPGTELRNTSIGTLYGILYLAPQPELCVCQHTNTSHTIRQW